MNWKALRAAHLRLGRRGESLACRLLEAKGWEVLERNYRTRAGELDIVARDGAALVFVEVKSRRKIDQYRPADNLSARQRLRNLHAARTYWQRIGRPNLIRRYDLIEVVATPFRLISIIHWKNC